MIRVTSHRGLRAALAPAGLALTGALLLGGCDRPPGGSVYVTAGRSDEIIRFDARDGSVRARISIDRRRHEIDEPHAVAVAPDQSFWYATVAHGQPSLWKFESGSDRLVGRVDLPSGGAAMIGISPDGSTAFIPDYDRAGDRVGRVAVVRLRDLVVVTHEPICGAPHDASVHPSENMIAIACAGSDEIVLVDDSLRVRRRIAVPQFRTADHTGAPGHMPAGGSRPLSVAWSEDGELLAVALHNAARVLLLDGEGNLVRTVTSGEGPAQVAFADDRTLVTADRMDGALSIIDVDTGELRRVPLPIELPHGIAVAKGVAYVACEGPTTGEGGVVAVDIERAEILWQRRAGRYVLAVAYTSD